MKLQDYRQTFYDFSGKASDLNRQIAFAGIALIWLFKKDTGGALSIPHELIYPAVLIVLSLTLDMLHYVVAALIWRDFYRGKEKAGVKETVELSHSPYREWPIFALFCAKIVAVLAAYIWLLTFFLRAISFK